MRLCCSLTVVVQVDKERLQQDMIVNVEIFYESPSSLDFVSRILILSI